MHSWEQGEESWHVVGISRLWSLAVACRDVAIEQDGVAGHFDIEHQFLAWTEPLFFMQIDLMIPSILNYARSRGSLAATFISY